MAWLEKNLCKYFKWFINNGMQIPTEQQKKKITNKLPNTNFALVYIQIFNELPN